MSSQSASISGMDHKYTQVDRDGIWVHVYYRLCHDHRSKRSFYIKPFIQFLILTSSARIRDHLTIRRTTDGCADIMVSSDSRKILQYINSMIKLYGFPFPSYRSPTMHRDIRTSIVVIGGLATVRKIVITKLPKAFYNSGMINGSRGEIVF